ncbi:hypothetical protein NC653_005352 [Populus alba x Populus x berolinensis]|uniref:Uncharacterized protein n=1 Tax=Populus alba x Populus x berolinensis TaxID=444605 RepID=A0AAD6RCP3_9ROSI|nr:hypothetical protein NC653_005352 [Populus alba x Populus x berolinensis]
MLAEKKWGQERRELSFSCHIIGRGHF